MDGKGSRAARLARVPRAAVPGGRHQDGQVEVSERKASKPEGSSRRIFRRDARMLGRNRPGSEGNLASDLENQDQAVNRPTAKPKPPRRAATETATKRKTEATPSRTRRSAAEAEAAEPKPPRRAQAAAEAKPAAEPQAGAEPKPAPRPKPAADAQAGRGSETAEPDGYAGRACDAKPEGEPPRLRSNRPDACSTASAAPQGNQGKNGGARSTWSSSRT